MPRMVRKALAAGIAAVAVAALTSPAQALKIEDVPGVGVDTGRFNLPIDCAITMPDLGGIKVFDLATNVDVQGVVTTHLGPGQEFWLTQGSGAITFPAWLTGLGGFVGINRADAVVSTLEIGASSANPPVINVMDPPQSITDIVITPGQELTVGLPLQGAFDVGPYRAPQSGRVTMSFEKAVAHVTLKAAWGPQVKIDAHCTPTAGNALLTLGVGGPAGQPPSKIHGQPLNFPPVAPGYVDGIINAPYECSFGGDTLAVGIAVGGTFPLSVPRAGRFSFTRASGALTIPAATVNELLDRGFSGSFSGRVTGLNLVVEGGTPLVQNVATDIAIPPTPLMRDREIVVSLPPTGTLTAGPFTPRPGAATLAIRLGDAAAELTLNGSTPLPVACAEPAVPVFLLENEVV